jgi:hypothetical protein
MRLVSQGAVRSGDFRAPAAGTILINHRTLVTNLAGGSGEEQVARRVNTRTPGAFEGEGNTIGMRAGLHDKVVLELAVASVVHHVDAGVHAGESDALVVRNIGVPLRAVHSGHIVRDGAQTGFALSTRGPVCSGQPKGDFAPARDETSLPGASAIE